MMAFKPDVHVLVELSFHPQSELGEVRSGLRTFDRCVRIGCRNGVLSVIKRPVGFRIRLHRRRLSFFAAVERVLGTRTDANEQTVVVFGLKGILSGGPGVHIAEVGPVSTHMRLNSPLIGAAGIGHSARAEREDLR